MKIMSWLPLLGFISCNNYLDVTPDRSLAILTTAEEYEELMNGTSLYQSSPAIHEFGLDDYYISTQVWASSSVRVYPAYNWQADIYKGNNGSGATQDWNAPYKNIYYCNVVLDGLKELNRQNSPIKYDEVKGHALFLRALNHYQLQEVYGQPYRPESAKVDLGIPLKGSSLLTEPVYRATVAETFEQIIQDVEESLNLLPASYQEQNKYRGSKAASCAFLSRIYLTMQDYDKSLYYANECLKYYSVLLDYNSLQPTYKFNFPDNEEVLFVMVEGGTSSFFLNSNTLVDSVLYASYDRFDLRKTGFFQTNPTTGLPNFKSMYSGSGNPFDGFAMDEVYLNRAECRARIGDEKEALDDLNTLLLHRYETGHFSPLTRENTDDVLKTILIERRKEMVIRGTKWTDLRRLNQDPKFAHTLKRVLDGVVYTLEPNSPKYTYPIPSNEVEINNLIQNER